MTENEPYAVSDAEAKAIAGATGVREEVVRHIAGDNYAAVKANAVKLHDLSPSSRTTPPAAKTNNADALSAASLAKAVKARMYKSTGGA